MSALRNRLRALPGFPEQLPVLDLADLPEDPLELLRGWLEEEIDRGTRQPHAMTFQTLREDGAPTGRTLVLKDIDEHGLHVATSRRSAKGRQLAADPRAAMTFFWRESGRQVRVEGTVTALDEEVSRQDWLARPTATGEVDPDWQVYALQPGTVTVMQAAADRRHTVVDYRREDGVWRH